MNDLPDEILGTILVKWDLGGGWRLGLTVPQVCKRWKRVFYSGRTMQLWQQSCTCFCEQEAGHEPDFAAHMRMFKRTAPLMSDAQFSAEENWDVCLDAARRLPDFLSCLSPSRLAWLHVEHMPLTTAALQCLTQLRQLRELSIVRGVVPGGRNLAAEVSQLDRLQRFEYVDSPVDGAVVAALSSLQRLEQAYLHSRGAPLPGLSPLAALAGTLTSLAVIEEVSRGSGLRMELAAALPKLQRITFGSPKLQVPSSDILVAAGAGEERTSFTYGMPAWVAGIELWRSEAGLGVFIHNVSLDLDGAGTALLAALHQPQGSLDLLWLQACRLSPAAFKCSAAQLAAAQRLVVQGCRGSGAQGTLGAAIGAILQQTPRLRSLDITCTEGSRCKGSTGLLPLVGKLCHLTSLELVNTGLHSLAGVLEGLPGLVHLDLRGNKLQRVPPSLSRCTQLTALLLSGNSQQVLDDAAVGVLASPPELRQLELPSAVPESVKTAMAAAAPHIQEITAPQSSS